MSVYDDSIIANAKTVAYWPLDDVSGNARDAKSSTYPATTIGSGITRQQAGPVLESLSYKGNNTSNAQIAVPHASALNGPGTTLELEFWLQFNGDQASYMHKAGTHSFQVITFADGQVWGSFAPSGGLALALGPAGSLRSGEWCMVNASWGSNLLTIYVNGVAVATAATSGSITTNTAVLNLMSQTASYYSNDYLSRCALYSTQLTAAERKAHYVLGNFEAIKLARGRPGRKLSFALCDLDGNVLSELPSRRDASVTIDLNGPRTASVTASVEEDVAELLTPFNTMLKVWLSGTIIFCGQVSLPRWIGSDRTVELNATDLSERLANSYTKSFAFQDGIDQSEIMWSLIDHAVDRNTFFSGFLGINRGSTPNSYLRDRFYPDGVPIWDQLVAMSQVTNGPDFELEPLDRTDGVWCQFNTYFPYQGYDRTDTAVFTFNTQENNASAFTSEPGGGEMVNYAIFAGQAIDGEAAPAWVAYSPSSIAEYGVWEHFESLPDVKYTATLQEYAEQLVAIRSQPIEFFDLVPAVEAGAGAQGYYRDGNGLWRQQSGPSYGVPPVFGPLASGGEYWIGDEIRAIGRDHGVEKDVTGRVITARLTEVGEHGEHVAVELTCAPTIEASDVTGSATTVSTEDFS